MGERCLLSHYVKMNTGSHNIMHLEDNVDIMDQSPITVERDVWIGIDKICSKHIIRNIY